MDRGAWWATVQGLTQSGHNWATKQQQEEDFRNTASRPHLQRFCYNWSGGVPASVCCFFFFKTKTNGKGNKTSSHPGNPNLQSELETTAVKHGLPMFAEEYWPNGPYFRFLPGLFPHIARVCVSVCPSLPLPRQIMLSFCFWTLTAFFATFFLSRKRQPIHPFASVTLVTQPLHNSNNIQIYFYIVHDYSLPEDCKLFEHIEFMSFITLSLGLRRLLGW